MLIALVATLPRQIEMTNNMHQFTSGWNELLAVWTRLRGVAANTASGVRSAIRRPHQAGHADPARATKNPTPSSSVDEAIGLILSKPTGRINVRGANGSGKSTLLTSLKSQVKNRAYYWPTADRLAFQFAQGMEPEDLDYGDDDDEPKKPSKPPGFSSGERQLRALREIVAHTAAEMYLLDEWDANLDPNNRAAADALVEELAKRARVVEISHRDRVLSAPRTVAHIFSTRP